MIKKIITIILFLFHFNALAQSDSIIGDVKSISEKIVYLIEEPTLEENCIDCDPTSFYQFGISLVTDPESYDSFFKIDWHNTAGCT